MWLVWLLLGVFLGFMVAALVAAAARGDLTAEMQRLRRLEDGLHRLELRVVAPGTGDLFRARLHSMVTMWGWTSDDGRWELCPLPDGLMIVVDEIGDPIK